MVNLEEKTDLPSEKDILNEAIECAVENWSGLVISCLLDTKSNPTEYESAINITHNYYEKDNNN